jgi:hypothetical protein
MDNKFYVPQETARRLKEAGYPVEQDAPITYHEAVDWLENNWIQFNMYRDRWTKIYSVFINYPNGGLAWKDGKLHSSSREQALNECILEAIEIVKRRQRLLQQKQQQ